MNVFDLYKDHEIKEEIVIGPVVIQEQPTLPHEILTGHEIHKEQDILQSNSKEKLGIEHEEQIHVQTTLHSKIKNKTEIRCDVILVQPAKPTFPYKRKEKIELRSKIKKKLTPLHDVHNNQGPKLSSQVLSNKRSNAQKNKENKGKLQISHANKIYTCDLCCKTFNFRGNLIRHINMHSGTTFSCKFCSKIFNSKRYLNNHEKNHLDDKGVKRYACNFCTKVFKDRSNFNRHRKRYCSVLLNPQKKDFKDDEGKLNCNYCTKKFKDKSNFNQHKRKYCNVLLDSRNNSEHRYSGNILNPMIPHEYTCDICNNKYLQKSTLIAHILKHENIKFECRKCKKKYNTRSSLTRHLHIHKKETKYKCNLCMKRFDRKISLKRHCGDNGKINVLVCIICKKLFNCKTMLDQHKKEHNTANETFDNKKYNCKLCNKSFLTKYNFKMHKQANLCQISYCCEICQKRFTAFHSLDRHMALHKK